MVWAQDSTVVFLVETWLVEARLGEIKDRLQMGNYLGVSKATLDGRLAFFGKKGVGLNVELSSLNHIDVLIN